MSDYITSIEIETGTKLHKDLLEPFERAAASDSATKRSSDNINYNTINMKRARCDADAGLTSNAETAVKKRKHNTETAITLRVLCPVYRMDSGAHTRKVSCFHQGFPTIARLKQHLVKEHNIPKLNLAFIKSNGFKQLGSIEAKWRRIFCNLFPAVSEDDIPSPYKDVSPNQGSLATIQSIFEDILERDNSEPGFSAAISNMLLQAVGKHTTFKSPTANFGLPTPPTSAESSPELRNLDATSSFNTYLTPMSPDSNCIDPLLFSNAAPDSSLMFDMACAWEQYNQKVETAPSVFMPTENTELNNSVCNDCFSQNVFRTKGTEVQVDVCGDCHSTDIFYQVVAISTDCKVQSGHDVETLMEVPNYLEGLGKDIEPTEDFAGLSAIKEEDLREDIDELFEF